MTVKLTKRTVDAIVPGDRASIVYDTDLKGFGVRIAPNGSLSWFVEYRPGAGGRRVAKKRMVIGSREFRRYPAGHTIWLQNLHDGALRTLAGLRYYSPSTHHVSSLVQIDRSHQTGVDEYFLDPIPVPQTTPQAYRATFTAQRGGELFLYVNDAVIGLPWLNDYYFKKNAGTAKVTVRLI
jgi:hypothetical protein